MHKRVEASMAFLDCRTGVSDATCPDSSVFLLAVEVVAGAVDLFALGLASDDCGIRSENWRSRVATDTEVSFLGGEVWVTPLE